MEMQKAAMPTQIMHVINICKQQLCNIKQLSF